MSGHSHWATIKRAKGAADAKKGKIFSKLGKEITIVVKAKGGDPDNNPTLRTLIAKAKAAQMPNDNIERAIKKGTGELESAALVDAQYEGIKGGVALVVNVLTDNKNRAAAEVGNVFKKNGIEFAKQGSATRLFDRLGPTVRAERDHAVALGVRHTVAEHGRLGRGVRLAEEMRQFRAVEDVVAEHEAGVVAAEELASQHERLRESVGDLLHLVGELHAEVGTVPEQPLEVRQVLRRGDHEHLADAGEHERGERVAPRGCRRA